MISNSEKGYVLNKQCMIIFHLRSSWEIFLLKKEDTILAGTFVLI